jgi:hypothetical protein
MEEVMSKSILSSLSIAAIACGAMLAFELGPASAFTLYGSSAQPLTSGQFDRVYYRGGVRYGGYRGGARYGGYRGGVRYGGYRGGYAYRGGYGYRGYGYRGGYGYHYGYGYHPYGYGYGYHPYGYGYGAAAVGAAAVGAAVAAHHCWIDSYGTRVCNYY